MFITLSTVSALYFSWRTFLSHASKGRAGWPATVFSLSFIWLEFPLNLFCLPYRYQFLQGNCRLCDAEDMHIFSVASNNWPGKYFTTAAEGTAHLPLVMPVGSGLCMFSSPGLSSFLLFLKSLIKAQKTIHDFDILLFLLFFFFLVRQLSLNPKPTASW